MAFKIKVSGNGPAGSVLGPSSQPRATALGAGAAHPKPNDGMRAHGTSFHGIPKGLAAFMNPDLSDPNQSRDPPAQPPAPVVQVSGSAALLCWKPLKQGVNRIVLQALPVKNSSTKPNFKKFEVGGKVGGRQTVLINGCDQISSAVIADLQLNQWYAFRLVVSNMFGAVEGEISQPRATGELVEEELKGSLRKKEKKRKGTATLTRRNADSPEVTDSRVQLQRAQERLAEEETLRRASTRGRPQPSSSGTDLAVSVSEPSVDTSRPCDVPSAAQDASVPPDSTSDAPQLERQQQGTPSDPDTDTAVSLEVPSAAPAPTLGTSVPKSVASRLAAPVQSNPVLAEPSLLEEQEKRRQGATKLFKAAGPAENRSRIYQALNPQPLWYESRRQKEDEDEGTGAETVVRVRGAMNSLVDSDVRDYSRPAEEESEANGAEVEGEEGEAAEEDGYDTDDAPDFGELKAELDEMRERRRQKEDARRKEMREEWLRKREVEERERQEELRRIAAREDKLKQKEVVTDEDVRAAQERLAREAEQFLQFKWE